MSTIHQRAALCVNDHTAFPLEFVAKCANAGYARVDVLLNPNHPNTDPVVPRFYVDGVKALGMKAWGRVWADDFSSPESMMQFILSERQRLQVTGFGINAEDGWEARDMEGATWSKRFLSVFRTIPTTAKLSLYLDTYNGCGGIDLRAWQNMGARLVCQTHHEGQTHEWPIDGYMSWAKQYGWTKPAMIKPEWGTYNPLPNRADQIASAQRADTKGFLAYYAEGGGDPANHLIPLLNEARAAGVTY